MIIRSLIRAKLGPIAESEYRAAAEDPHASMLKIPQEKLAALNDKWRGTVARDSQYPPKGATRDQLIEWRASHPGCAALRLLYQHMTGKRATCRQDREELARWWRSIVADVESSS